MNSHGRIFKPFDVAGFTVIPEGASCPKNSGIPIILGKKGAFGSGEHETTKACLEFIAGISDISARKVFDLGSGTAILAIAAATLGAESTIALDIDWYAAISGEENIQLNNLKSKIHSVCGELACLGNSLFDLVMANIYADIHLLLANRVAALTRLGGTIIISGIPLQDKFEVQQKYIREGCELMDSRIGDEFATYLMRKAV